MVLTNHYRDNDIQAGGNYWTTTMPNHVCMYNRVGASWTKQDFKLSSPRHLMGNTQGTTNTRKPKNSSTPLSMYINNL